MRFFFVVLCLLFTIYGQGRSIYYDSRHDTADSSYTFSHKQRYQQRGQLTTNVIHFNGNSQGYADNLPHVQSSTISSEPRESNDQSFIDDLGKDLDWELNEYSKGAKEVFYGTKAVVENATRPIEERLRNATEAVTQELTKDVDEASSWITTPLESIQNFFYSLEIKISEAYHMIANTALLLVVLVIVYKLMRVGTVVIRFFKALKGDVNSSVLSTNTNETNV